MLAQEKLNMLVCNILNEKRYSNCRLCLKNIMNDYVRLHDMVCLDITNPKAACITLSEALKMLQREDEDDFSSELPGLEACCTGCVDSALHAIRFLEASRRSFNTLNRIFTNLSKALLNDMEVSNDAQAIYITIEDSSSDLIFVNNMSKKIRTKDKKYPYECFTCNEYFENLLELNSHNLTLHNCYTCDKCHDVFKSQTDLNVHVRNDHQFECTECLQSWTSEEGLQRHQDRMHNTHVCKECGKSCKGLDKLHVHESKHVNKYVCPKCSKQYTTKDFYTRHVSLCLVDKIDPHPIRSEYKKLYSCDNCGKAYSTPGGLRVHIRFAHENAKPHVCKECGKKFTAPSYLRIHMVKHTGEKNFECDICKGRFVSKEALLYHIRRHTGEKPYSCKLCDERFVNASARAEHIKFRHVGPTLMCEICSKKFVTTLFLKQHIRRHHDPSSKLYYGRIPPNMPGEQNMRLKTEIESD